MSRRVHCTLKILVKMEHKTGDDMRQGCQNKYRCNYEKSDGRFPRVYICVPPTDSTAVRCFRQLETFRVKPHFFIMK